MPSPAALTRCPCNPFPPFFPCKPAHRRRGLAAYAASTGYGWGAVRAMKTPTQNKPAPASALTGASVAKESMKEIAKLDAESADVLENIRGLL